MAEAKKSAKQGRQSLVATLAALDQRLSNRLYLSCQGVPRWTYKLLEYGGDGVVWVLVTFTALFLPSTPAASRLAWANLLLGLLLDLVLVGTLKGLFQRTRPVYNHKADFIVVVAVDHFSFPSGHSARASFVAVFVLACLAQLPGWLRLIALAWAVTTALSRAAMGRHYLGDVLAGLLVGVLNVAILTRVRVGVRYGWMMGVEKGALGLLHKVVGMSC
ncbi:hypothetical protein N2152v2_002974 [Parachlorella kessleri]